MRKKVYTLLLVLAIFVLVITGCANNDAPSDELDLRLTIEELSQYDGKNGNPAYIVVDGIIYDVTDSAAWRDGEHNGFTAGNDLTEEIKNVSPHGVSKLNGIPVVGELIE